MILDTTNISSGSSTPGSVLVEKWVWEWYQDALNIARSQLAKLEVENKELKEQLANRDEYTAALHKDYQRKDVENRALKDQVERLKQQVKGLSEDNWRLHERKDQLVRECKDLRDGVDKHWEYLEDVILGMDSSLKLMADASDAARKVAMEIKQSRGIA